MTFAASSGSLYGVISHGSIPYPSSAIITVFCVLVTVFLTSEFFHIRASCADPGQLTSTLVKISLASQVACIFSVVLPLRLTYTSPWTLGFSMPIWVPVSYTHLDVYKRQGLNFIKFHSRLIHK